MYTIGNDFISEALIASIVKVEVKAVGRQQESAE
jgi:hypothetical protein